MTDRRTFLTFAAASVTAAAAPKRFLVYVGTYTNGGKSKGIYAFRMDPKSGEFEPLGVIAEIQNPSFLAIHPNQRNLYAVGELASYQGQAGGAVSAFQMDRASGKLTPINTVSTKGGGPCHLNVDRSGRTLAVANYGGGSVASFPIQTNGRLEEAASFIQHTGSSANPQRQREPHAHSVNFSRDNRFVIAADLGTDHLMIYRLDPVRHTISLHEAFKVTPGAGPRHFAFHPKGKYAYVINELQSTIMALSWDSQRGAFRELQTISTIPEDYKAGGQSTAEVVVHPGGQFVYGSNRGHDSIAAFRVGKDGKLTALGQFPTGGKTPRNFAIDPTGNWLLAANQNSDFITVFRVDRKTGKLENTGKKLEAPAPVCVRYVAALS